jgi:hypothetical protein
MGRSSNTTEVKVPEYLENAARQNIDLGNQIAEIGYVPYYGPDVAAMTPMQMAAGDNIGAAASAFGLAMPTSTGAGMPTAMDYNGIGAYSSGALYDQALAELQQRAPAQFEALRAMFIDPVTGAGPTGIYGQGMPAEMAQPPSGGREGRERIEQARERSRTGRMQGPISPSGAVAESGFRADLTRSLSDPFYDPPGNVLSRNFGNSSPKSRAGDSMGGGK